MFEDMEFYNHLILSGTKIGLIKVIKVFSFTIT